MQQIIDLIRRLQRPDAQKRVFAYIGAHANGVINGPNVLLPVQRSTIQDFIESVYDGIHWKSMVLCSLVYLERLQSRLAADRVTIPHRSFLVCLVLTVKYTKDGKVDIGEWAEAFSSFTAEELKVTERSILSHLDWDLSISSQDLRRALMRCEASISMRSLVLNSRPSHVCGRRFRDMFFSKGPGDLLATDELPWVIPCGQGTASRS